MNAFPESPQAMAAAQAAYAQRKANDPTGFLRAEPDPVRDTAQLGTWIDNSRFGDPADTSGLEADEDLAALKGLHTDALAHYQAMLDTFREVAADDDPSLNTDGRLKIAAGILEPRLDDLAGKAERELARVDAAIGEEEAAITASTRKADPVDVATFNDIRQYWRSPDAEKAKRMLSVDPALGSADGPVGAAALDMQTLQALATAPAYLSGLTEKQQGRVRAELAKRLAPERVKRVAALRAGKAATLQALQVLDTKANRYVDFKRARELRERETQRKAKDRA